MSGQQLPVVANCSGCGACCREQESPPGYIYIAAGAEDWPDEDDVRRVREMPEELRGELRQYIVADCQHERSPECLWYDPVTMQCKHHEWRPSICRDFDVGSDECLGWRKEFEV
ncbi:MAG: YkgJ family cysteine cluster protein [Micavibrio sp.]|nr:YkgJ family cysteine cluster protein [Micavibrio sp.]